MEEAEIEDKSEQHSIKITELETCSQEVNKSNGRITGRITAKKRLIWKIF